MIGNEVLQLDVEASRGSGALLAGSFSSALVFPRHTGLNELRCNVNDHVIAGMRALYFVDTKGNVSTSVVVDPEDVDVTHYIAADEIDWDYAPLGRDGCTGDPFGEDDQVFTEPGPVTPGSRYIKAVYREYRDATFSRLKGGGKRSFSGVVGPLLHFEVGEVVRIVFQNNLRFSTNINFVGLELLNSTSAGALAVSPGDRVTYLFRVRREAGPSRSDLSAVPYVYYSSVDPISHTAAGLTGVIAVTKRGRLRRRSRLPKGTRRAYPLLLQIFRENDSPLIRRSLQKFALNAGNATSALLEELAEDEDWLESNAMHSINGYLYGNNPLIRAKAPSVIRFYVFGYGSEASMHSPVWMGQIVQRTVYRGNAANGVQIMPFNAETVDVKAVNRGKWPIICKVADHVVGGMKLCMRVS
ncbi:Cupredoxin [Gracilaria domingensis]|nr:Cupredoxin [Gracilaria domingensis]